MAATLQALLLLVSSWLGLFAAGLGMHDASHSAVAGGSVVSVARVLGCVMLPVVVCGVVLCMERGGWEVHTWRQQSNLFVQQTTARKGHGVGADCNAKSP